MNIGMLWFDNDPKTEISIKVERAATYYRQKYGKSPTLCFVHPSMLSTNSSQDNTAPIKSGNITIHPSRSVLPNHFWIGVNGTAMAES